MSKKVVALAAASVVLLAGCDDSSAPYQDEEQAYVDEQAGASTRQQLQNDEQDRQQALKELQSKDPTVKDVYFTMDENGQKQMHVVREEANGQNSDSVWPLVGGVAAGALGGYLLAKTMNQNGGYQHYQQQNRPLTTQQYDEDERKKRRAGAGAAYNAALMNQNRSAVRSAPNYRQNMNTRVSQWRSSPSTAPATVRSATQARATAIMSSGGGARAASHGGSGFSS